MACGRYSQSYLQLHQFAYFRRDTVSSVGVIQAGSLPFTDSADHVCFFHRAFALDERRVQFLPEYVHGVVYKKDPAPERPGKQPTSFSMTIGKSEAQIHETGLNPSPHIKEVWFPGTHSDM